MKQFGHALMIGAVAVFWTVSSARSETFTVFAAASMKTALDQIMLLFEQETGHAGRASYAGSSILARQIEQGAPADVFVSANVLWMDYLDQRSAIKSETRFDLTANRIVLISHQSDVAPFALDDLSGWQEHVGEARVAMALVEAVPAGIYGRTALGNLGVWQHFNQNVVQSDNVRSALSLVARGEAAFGIVYASDAIAEPRVTVVGVFPEDSHPPIRFPVAITQVSTSDAARSFMDYLRSTEARKVLIEQGFQPIKE